MSQAYPSNSRFLTWGLILFSAMLLFHPLSEAQERFRRFPPSPQPLLPLRLPEMKSYQLSNELRLTVVRKAPSPLIHIKIIISVGESHSPDSLPGLATFTANLLSKGTLTLSAQDFEDSLASIGGEYTVSVYPELTVLSLSCLEEFLDKGLEIIGKILLEPSFNQKKIITTKTSFYHGMLKKKAETEYIAKRLLFRILFQDHAYQKTTFNTDGIKNFNRDNVRSFFQTYYRPNNAHIVLIGDINLETASRLVSGYLNTWKPNHLDLPMIVPPKPAKKMKIVLVDIPHCQDTTLFLGNNITPYSPNDFFPYSVFNRVIGQTTNSRIFMNLRESKGYAYYAFSHLEFFKTFGVFYVRAKIRPDVTVPSIEEILREISLTMKTKIPGQEIEQAKSYLLGNFPIQLEDPSVFATKITEVLAFNLGISHWNKYYENIMKVDSNMVFSLVRRIPFLTPVIVIVTNANLGAEENPFIDKLTERFGEVAVYNTMGILQYTLK